MSATFNKEKNKGVPGGEREREENDRRTIPERIATYFRTAISLANLFSPGSRNEVEAAGLSETATTTPLRKPGDDIPRRGWYMEGVEEEGRGEGRVRCAQLALQHSRGLSRGEIYKKETRISRKENGLGTRDENVRDGTTRWPRVPSNIFLSLGTRSNVGRPSPTVQDISLDSTL